MKNLAILLVIALVSAEEYVVTPEYTEYLKRHVTWEVMDYEDNIFRGWTVSEIQAILNQEEIEEVPGTNVVLETGEEIPSIDWRQANANCIHEIQNQGSCGSCWAFSAAGVASDRCCLGKKDYGWLSPQELVSCDTANHGCSGGWEFNALDYVKKNGLVPWKCFDYKARNLPCPKTCDDKSSWTAAHVCKCKDKVFCQGTEAMAKCIQTGPVTAGMYVYRDFTSYKSGIYHWNKQGSRLGGHAIRCLGYATSPEKHFICANSWGTNWGEKGYFRIGVGEVGIDTRNPSYCDPA